MASSHAQLPELWALEDVQAIDALQRASQIPCLSLVSPSIICFGSAQTMPRQRFGWIAAAAAVSKLMTRCVPLCDCTWPAEIACGGVLSLRPSCPTLPREREVCPPSSTCRQRQGLRLPQLLHSRATLLGLKCIMLASPLQSFRRAVKEVTSLPVIATPQACNTHTGLVSHSLVGPQGLAAPFACENATVSTLPPAPKHGLAFETRK